MKNIHKSKVKRPFLYINMLDFFILSLFFGTVFVEKNLFDYLIQIVYVGDL